MLHCRVYSPHPAFLCSKSAFLPVIIILPSTVQFHQSALYLQSFPVILQQLRSTVFLFDIMIGIAVRAFRIYPIPQAAFHKIIAAVICPRITAS